MRTQSLFIKKSKRINSKNHYITIHNWKSISEKNDKIAFFHQFTSVLEKTIYYTYDFTGKADNYNITTYTKVMEDMQCIRTVYNDINIETLIAIIYTIMILNYPNMSNIISYEDIKQNNSMQWIKLNYNLNI